MITHILLWTSLGRVTGRIENIEIWDGKRALGSCRLEWTSDDRDGTISAVTPAAGADEAPGPEADWYVIPGLIDTHVHLIGYAGPGRVEFLTWPLITRPEEQVLHGLAHARAALAGGVTTLRDLSADEIQFSLARAVNAGIVSGPRLLAYGMVSMTAGHGDLFTPPAFPHRKPTADGPDACRRLVREWARAGADGIKIATSGGVLSVGDKAVWRNHTPAEITRSSRRPTRWPCRWPPTPTPRRGSRSRWPRGLTRSSTAR